MFVKLLALIPLLALGLILFEGQPAGQPTAYAFLLGNATLQKIEWSNPAGGGFKVVFDATVGPPSNTLTVADRTLAKGATGTFKISATSTATTFGFQVDLEGLDGLNYNYVGNQVCGTPTTSGAKVTCTKTLSCSAGPTPAAGVLFSPVLRHQNHTDDYFQIEVGVFPKGDGEDVGRFFCANSPNIPAPAPGGPYFGCVFHAEGATECNAVGGIAELPEVAGTPLETAGSSGNSTGLIAGVVAAIAAGTVTLTGAAWYARRRFTRS